MSEFKCTLVYDSECTLCCRFKKALELIDHKKTVEFLSLHDSTVYTKYPELSKEDCEIEVHLINDLGEIFKGPKAIAYLVKILPGVSKFSWLIDSESGKNATNAFYNRVSEMRIMQKRKCYTCGHPKKKR